MSLIESDTNINHSIMNKDVIDREELINYLTLILETDGELEKFFIREELENPVPDVLAFRNWLQIQTFDTIIDEDHFEEYIKNDYEHRGEYDPESFLHSYLDWEAIAGDVIDSDYDILFDNETRHPLNIFQREFYYHI
jgi:hypothetical protein